MAGRDAYLELGFHEPVNRPNLTTPDAQETINNQSFYARDSAKFVEQPSEQEARPQTSRPIDFIAGVLLICAILLLGVIAGYLGRGLSDSANNPASEIAILSTQTVPAFEALPSGESSDIVFFGSTVSEQFLAIDPLETGDALLLVKSYPGAGAEDSSTNLLRYSVSGQEHDVTQLSALKGEGFDLIRLSDGALISTAVSDNQLMVSRIGEAGRVVWTKAFETSAIDRSEVAVAKFEAGFVLLTPAQDRSLARVTSIGSDGFVAWEATLDRPNSLEQAFISVDVNGQTFAVLGASAQADPGFGQNVVVLDENGQIVRQRAVTVQGDDVISGIAAHPAGGATILISGSLPRLERVDTLGLPIDLVNLPYMRFQTNAHLLPLESGELIIASTYAIVGDRVDLMLEQRTMDGALIGQRTVALPEGASLDAFIPATSGEYLIGGSIREDRYLPTDLFMQRVAFSAQTHPIIFSEPADPGLSDQAAAMDSIPVSPESQTIVVSATEAIETPDLPIIASLSVAPETAADGATAIEPSPIVSAEPALANEVAEMAQTETQLSAPTSETEAIVAETQAAEAEAPPSVISEISQSSVFASAADSDMNNAAISRFLEQSIAVQCRFTCMDSVSGNTFPMTGHFLPSMVTAGTDATAVHARVCQAADLAPKWDTQPTCGAP